MEKQVTGSSSIATIDYIGCPFLPVRDLDESIAWYSDMFGFQCTWKSERQAGMQLGNSTSDRVIFVKIDDFKPVQEYVVFNMGVKDIHKTRQQLQQQDVSVTDILPGEPIRFDFFDVNGNSINIHG